MGVPPPRGGGGGARFLAKRVTYTSEASINQLVVRGAPRYFVLSPAGAVGPGTGDIATPPVCLSVRPSVCLSVWGCAV